MTLVLLVGCSLGTNTAAARAGAPFVLGRATSALWAESEHEGSGQGRVLLAGAELSCDEARDGELLWRDDTPLWDTWAVLATFDYYASRDDTGGAGPDPGWEGTYYGGSWETAERQGDTLVQRRLDVVVYADGQSFDLGAWPALGELTRHGSTVEGRLHHELLDARFALESCGELTWGGGDTS